MVSTLAIKAYCGVKVWHNAFRIAVLDEVSYHLQAPTDLLPRKYPLLQIVYEVGWGRE
jgi:hypothetical protein